MEAYLQGPSGRIVLGPGVLTIGRAFDNLLIVNHSTASSHHAEIRPGFYGYSLTDCGSTNGTFVNEQQLAPYLPLLLQDGDRIRIGDMTFSYGVGSPNFQNPTVQRHKDAPTAKVRAIELNAFSQSEQFGYQPPNPYSSSPPQQSFSPSYSPAMNQANVPPWASNSATVYGLSEQQPVPPSFTPAFDQSNTPVWATSRANGNGMPVQTQPYAPPPLPPPPASPKSNTWLKVLLICLSIVLILGAAGGGITAYILTRPQPVMTVTSDYHVGTTPAGSTGTVLHFSAQSFSGSSTITVLLDSLPVASNQHVSSDANGNVKADLVITTGWAVGNHTLIARDASGYATKVGKSVVIVPQGQAHTPGPDGAPPDDMSFILNAHVQPQDAGTGKQLTSYTEELIITGKPDPSGGTVCTTNDDGQSHFYTGDAGNGITYNETAVMTCSGTYKGGKLTYTETVTSEKEVYTDGVTCQEHTPYVYEHLEGTFTGQDMVSGTLSDDSVTSDCSKGGETHQFNFNAEKGSWTAQF